LAQAGIKTQGVERMGEYLLLRLRRFQGGGWSKSAGNATPNGKRSKEMRKSGAVASTRWLGPLWAQGTRRQSGIDSRYWKKEVREVCWRQSSGMVVARWAQQRQRASGRVKHTRGGGTAVKMRKKVDSGQLAFEVREER